MISDSEKAFPQDRIDMYGIRSSEGGMTLRDYLAVRAPEVPVQFERKNWREREIREHSPGRFTEVEVTKYEPPEDRQARWSYVYADAMLKAREK